MILVSVTTQCTHVPLGAKLCRAHFRITLPTQSRLRTGHTLSNVDCGAHCTRYVIDGVYLINYHISDNTNKPPVLGKPLDELGDKPYDLNGVMGAKSMMNFINYIQKYQTRVQKIMKLKETVH